MNHEIAYYITAHGYGHGVRSCDIIRAINSLYPETSVLVVSDLPAPFLYNRIGSNNISVQARSFDLGMVQLDSIRVDVAATLARARALCDERERLMREETAFLKKQGIRLVIADIPSIPLEAAARAGITCLAVGNFSWDWIYSEFLDEDLRWKPVVEMFRSHYAQVDLLLRLPFHDDMTAFSRREDIPPVASPGKSRREELACLTGCDVSKKWILLSFTTLDWNEEALERVESMTNCEFFTVLPLRWDRCNIHAVSREDISFADVVATVDIVISKPGFGILSDCIVNHKPLIYAERTNFREYPILEAAIHRYLKHVHIPADDLYRGNLEESLNAIELAAEPLESLSAGGAEIAARRIHDFLK